MSEDMAQTIRDAALETRTARSRLDVRLPRRLHWWLWLRDEL